MRQRRSRDVGTMSVAELRREARTLQAWIRDVKAPKNARLREIRAEIDARRDGGRTTE